MVARVLTATRRRSRAMMAGAAMPAGLMQGLMRAYGLKGEGWRRVKCSD